MNSKLENKHALLTGAASGLGLSLFKELNQKGYTVHLIDKDFERDSEENSKTFKYKYDLSNLENLNELANKIKQKSNKIDLLINNAAYEVGSLIEEIPFDEFKNNINANFLAPVKLIKLFISELEMSQGKILNIISDAAFRGVPTRSSYCSSKAALGSFTESIRLELKEKSIDVVYVIPPKLNTNFFNNIQYFGKLKKDKISYSDKRPFFDNNRFAKILLNKVDKNKLIITKFTIAKVLTGINFIFPLVCDIVVEKFSSWKKIKTMLQKK